jgi:hypothetical protein
MIQAPFGSTAPGWPGLSSPMFAWPQTPIAIANPVVAPQGVGAPEPIAARPFDWAGFGGMPMASGPLSTPLVVPQGVTAPALIAAVAARRGIPQGPANDHDVEELLYDALELLPGAADVEVRCEGGRVTLTGSVPHKRIKRDVGELAWAIPAINDVQNTIAITGRRRSRAFGRENESQPGAQGRKQS